MFSQRNTVKGRMEELQGEYAMHSGLKQHMELVNRFYQEHGTVMGCPNVTESAAKLIDEGIKDGTFPDAQPYSKYDLTHVFYEMQRIEHEIEALGGHVEKVDISLPGELNKGQEQKPFYKTALEKTLEEITEDIFLRADAFSDAPWYGDFEMFTRIGVCEPTQEHALDVQKALKMMGYSTHTKEHDGKIFIVPGDAPPNKSAKAHEHER